MGILDRFYYGIFAGDSVRKVVEEKLTQSPRFAYVLQPPTLHQDRIGEVVATSRGMIVKAFPHIDTALEWLHSPAKGSDLDIRH